LAPTWVGAKHHTIEMKNNANGQSMVFVPGYLHVEVGDTIEFVPVDQGHNSQSVFVPEKAASWKAATDETIRITLSHPGIYIYECGNHAIMSMMGIIQVGEAVNRTLAETFFADYRAKQITNKSRLDQYLAKIQ
jgi:pseudoazurin